MALTELSRVPLRLRIPSERVWPAGAPWAEIVVEIAALPLIGAADAHAGFAVAPRHAVVAAENDEHLVLGGHAAAEGAGVADAVAGPGAAVTYAVVAGAELTSARPVQARDAAIDDPAEPPGRAAYGVKASWPVRKAVSTSCRKDIRTLSFPFWAKNWDL